MMIPPPRKPLSKEKVPSAFFSAERDNNILQPFCDRTRENEKAHLFLAPYSNNINDLREWQKMLLTLDRVSNELMKMVGVVGQTRLCPPRRAAFCGVGLFTKGGCACRRMVRTRHLRRFG